MTDPEQLLRQFIDEDRARGTADPIAYLARVHGASRDELEALIDGYLSRAPRRRFDADAFAGSPAARVTESIDRSMLGAGGRWPTLLPRLRHQAQLRRAEVVQRLAAALGVSGQEAKVAGYYHAMELGTLAPSGVSDRVLAALSEIVGESAAVLRRAGSGLSGVSAAGAESAPTFARVAEPNPDFVGGGDGEVPTDARQAEPDEVDRLFTGG